MKSLNTRFNEEVFSPYLDLLKARCRFHKNFAHAKSVWEESLTIKKLINGPYLEKSQMYATGDALDTLPLLESTKRTISKRLEGHGGQIYISKLLGCSIKTIQRGIAELKALPDNSKHEKRVKRSGGGRKPYNKKN